MARSNFLFVCVIFLVFDLLRITIDQVYQRAYTPYPDADSAYTFVT